MKQRGTTNFAAGFFNGNYSRVVFSSPAHRYIAAIVLVNSFIVIRKGPGAPLLHSRTSETLNHQLRTPIYPIFTSALAQRAMQTAGIARGGLSVRQSVCPSVRHTPVLYQNEESQRHDFFTIRQPEHSSFQKYLAHHEIRQGSPRARAISETGVGTNWRFWRFFDQ